jgi:GNAT superfamily N-acetyltransferase
VTVVVDDADVLAVRRLRHDVLRGVELPWEESIYASDDDERTFHLAARDGDQVVGCATWFPEPCQGEPAWRLRGMAVARDRQGEGIGAQLMAAAFARLADRGADLLWCNARISALPFYEAHGFRAVGEPFLAVGTIPHTVALRRLDPAPPRRAGS